MQSSRRSPQQEIAEFVAVRPSAWLQDEALFAARCSLLDTLAVAFAGTRQRVARRAAAAMRAERRPVGAVMWASNDCCSPESAALLNAVCAHALDYDDVAPAWRGHPGAVLWPSLLACASLREANFDEILESFIVGFEVGARLGHALIDTHYAAGWHSTATVGVIAAAAACCALLRLDADHTSNAIGLAAAQAGGSQANFGSEAKAMQAGFAASAAVRATLFAQAGVRSSPWALEGTGGFGDLYASRKGFDIRAGTDATPEILASGIEVKLYPICYAAHRAVAAALQMREEVVPNLKSVARIVIEGTPGSHKPLLARLPASPDEARFSVEFAVACALLTGSVRLEHVTESMLLRPDVQRLMTLGEASETGLSAARARSARVTVVLDDGRRIERSVSRLLAADAAEQGGRALEGKVADCLAQVNAAEWAPRLCRAVLHEEADVHRPDSELMRGIRSSLMSAVEEEEMP